METFKVVIDGFDLTKEDRERIEHAIHRAMLGVFTGDGDGEGDGDGTGGKIEFRPVVHPEGLKQVHPGRPNGEILMRAGLEKELQEILEKQFGPDARLAGVRARVGIPDHLDVADAARQASLGERAKGAQSGDAAP